MRNEKFRFSAYFIFVTTQQILVKFVSVRTETENLRSINFSPWIANISYTSCLNCIFHFYWKRILGQKLGSVNVTLKHL
jgi:hypothetical protein